MDLAHLRAPRGAAKYKKRRGRGSGSGHGKTSCRGHKGANARTGSTTHMAFEGGQMPLIRRIPKRGFTSKRGVFYQIANVDRLNMFKNDSVVDMNMLAEKGVVAKPDRPVKILGSGELKRTLTVKASAFSAGAKKKIEGLGGKAEVVSDTR